MSRRSVNGSLRHISLELNSSGRALRAAKWTPVIFLLLPLLRARAHVRVYVRVRACVCVCVCV